MAVAHEFEPNAATKPLGPSHRLRGSEAGSKARRFTHRLWAGRGAVSRLTTGHWQSSSSSGILTMMSRQNVELARQYVEAFNAKGLDGTQQWRHPEIELHDPPNFPDADQYVGEAAFRERVESYLAIGWDGQFRVEEYVDAGEEVVVIWRVTGRGALGDVPLEAAFGHVWLFEAGRMRRVRQYLSRQEALDAVGLPG